MSCVFDKLVVIQAIRCVEGNIILREDIIDKQTFLKFSQCKKKTTFKYCLLFQNAPLVLSPPSTYNAFFFMLSICFRKFSHFQTGGMPIIK